VPPLELPAQTGLSFFRLNVTEGRRMWDRIKEEQSIAARWPDMATADFQIALYMTCPTTEQVS